MKLALLFLFFFRFASAAEVQVLTLDVKGMVCSFCAQGLVKTLKKDEAVEDVLVDLDSHQVKIRSKSGKSLDRAELVKKVETAGFNVGSESVKTQPSN